MTESRGKNVPAVFWVVAGLAMLWSLSGVAIFLLEVFSQEAMMEHMTDEQKEWTRSIPRWVYAVFAIAVTTGLLGSILLLLRKSLAVPFFSSSLLAVLIQMTYTMVIANGIGVMGASGLIMPLVVVALSFSWLAFSFLSEQMGWLRR